MPKIGNKGPLEPSRGDTPEGKPEAGPSGASPSLDKGSNSSRGLPNESGRFASDAREDRAAAEAARSPAENDSGLLRPTVRGPGRITSRKELKSTGVVALKEARSQPRGTFEVHLRALRDCLNGFVLRDAVGDMRGN